MITFEVPDNDERIIHCPFYGDDIHQDDMGAASYPHLVMIKLSVNGVPD